MKTTGSKFSSANRFLVIARPRVPPLYFLLRRKGKIFFTMIKEEISLPEISNKNFLQRGEGWGGPWRNQAGQTGYLSLLFISMFSNLWLKIFGLSIVRYCSLLILQLNKLVKLREIFIQNKIKSGLFGFTGLNQCSYILERSSRELSQVISLPLWALIVLIFTIKLEKKFYSFFFESGYRKEVIFLLSISMEC